MNNTYSPASAWKPALLALGLVGAAFTGAHAQALNYPAASSFTYAGTYTDLTTGSAISTPNTDDSNSGATDIGFTFNYGGTAFTQFVLNTNGFIRLGANAPVTPYFGANGTGATGGPLTVTANTNVILPFNTDLQAGTGTTEYRVATSGSAPNRICTIQWRNVSDKDRAGASATIPKQFSNFSFQVKLYETTNAVEFVYGTATPSTNATTASFSAVGLRGNGAASNQIQVVVKASNNAWAQGVFTDGNYVATGNAFNFRNAPSVSGITLAQVLPDPGRTFHFDTPVANDLQVQQVYSIERLPTTQAYAYRASIRNAGTAASSAATVTLNVAGANTATQTVSVAGMAAGANTIVTFPNVTFNNAGTNTVTVSLPSDGNNGNNSRQATTVTGASNPTTAATFSYINPNQPSTSSYGFGVSTSGAFTGAFCAAFTTNRNFTVNAVRAFLGTDANADGAQLAGVVTDINGNVLAESDPFIASLADLGTLHTFTLSTPVVVPAGTFLVGLETTVDQTQYFAMAVQPESPQRPGTFFTLTGPTPTDIITNATIPNIRYMLEAGGFGSVLTTASPTLGRAFTLYPNPSTDGQFTLAVRGANAPNGLSVEVLNQLGQRVYNGSARDNFTSTLDLSNLANGIYFVTLRNGEEFSTTKLSINR